LEFLVRLADGVNGRVGLDEGAPQGVGDSVIGVFEIGQGDFARGLLRGLFPHGVAAHAVGDQEDVPVPLPIVAALGQQGGVRVLIVTAADADVGQLEMFKWVETDHSRSTTGR